MKLQLAAVQAQHFAASSAMLSGTRLQHEPAWDKDA